MAQVKLLKIASGRPTEHDGTADDLTLLSLATDTIDERTGAAGVTVDGVVLKDSGATFAADVTIYEATNDGNPEIRLGSADAEEAHIQSVYDSGAQTLDYVLFQTDVASATANKGLFRFNVDGADILDIDDGGIDLDTGGALSINGTDVLDATTLGSGVTASSLTSVGTIATGTWEATDVGVAHGGTGRSTATAYAVICGGTTGTGAHQSIASVGTSGHVLTSNGAGALPTFQAVSATLTVSYTNGNAGAIAKGDVVYLESGVNDTVELADADTIAHADQLVGVVSDASISAAASGEIVVSPGQVITGVLSSATAGDIYYLSSTGTTGNTLTTTAPTGGPALVQIGIAKNATDLIYSPNFIADTTA
jgi:hypothetical protein